MTATTSVPPSLPPPACRPACTAASGGAHSRCTGCRRPAAAAATAGRRQPSCQHGCNPSHVWHCWRQQRPGGCRGSRRGAAAASNAKHVMDCSHAGRRVAAAPLLLQLLLAAGSLCSGSGRHHLQQCKLVCRQEEAGREAQKWWRSTGGTAGSKARHWLGESRLKGTAVDATDASWRL